MSASRSHRRRVVPARGRVLAGDARSVRQAASRPQPARSGDLGRALPGAVGRDVLRRWESPICSCSLIAIPAAGFLVRTFILFHDCSHGSFLASRRANLWLGTVLGLLVYSPFLRWRHDHAIHHATSGDLDRRGGGDVRTLTVTEYSALSAPRAARLPAVSQPAGDVRHRADRGAAGRPRWIVAIGPPAHAPQRDRHQRRAGRLLIVALCWLMGWRDYLLVQAPTLLLAGSAGIWLFYVQHQFEDAYWESAESWSYADAALRGSSYLKLPRVLQFFSGNIGLHHVHHLSARIPNYNLQRAHDENPIFHEVPTLSLGDGLRAVRLKLWDEKRRGAW